MKRKSFFKFVNHTGTYILLFFLLFFIGVGVYEVFNDGVALGIGIICFYAAIITMYFVERYKKWRKLYG